MLTRAVQCDHTQPPTVREGLEEFPVMNREYHKWHSPALGRDMELLVFGHAGTPYLVFPTSMGRFFDYENRGMIDAVR